MSVCKPTYTDKKTGETKEFSVSGRSELATVYFRQGGAEASRNAKRAAEKGA